MKNELEHNDTLCSDESARQNNKDETPKDATLDECKDVAKKLKSASMQADVSDEEVQSKFDELWELIRRGADVARILCVIKWIAEKIQDSLNST